MASRLTRAQAAAEVAAFMLIADTVPWQFSGARVQQQNETSTFFFALAKVLGDAGMFERNAPQHFFAAAWGSWIGYMGQEHPHASAEDVEFGRMVRAAAQATLDAIKEK